ncbi:MAG: hypothetical protein P1V51_06690 [Deltaproteobacteria bacterium]|nr:hypothetical protein [Deltaproteobacteria bacterium]
MSEIHLTPQRWQALLEGTLPEDERAALRAHLETDCELCEERLAEASLAGEVDALDGEADEALLGVREAGWPADELAGRRIERALRRPPRRLLWVASSAVAAAAALFLLVSGPSTGPGAGEGVRLKGGDERALPRLELALAGEEGALRALAGDALVAREGHLLLRFDAPEEGLCGALRVESGGALLLEREALCPARGSSTLADGEAVVAIALDDPGLGETIEVTFEREGGGSARVAVRLNGTR